MGGPLGLNNIVHFSLQLTIRCKYFEEMQELGELKSNLVGLLGKGPRPEYSRCKIREIPR
jgi:hypothetical protein